MTRQGTVTKVEGKIVHISTKPLECCSGGEDCHCLQTGKNVAFKAYSAALEVKPGDFVEAGVEAGQTVIGLFKVFALPFLGFALGFFLPALLGLASMVQILSGLGGAGVGLAVGLVVFKADERSLPQVKRIIPTLDLVPKI